MTQTNSKNFSKIHSMDKRNAGDACMLYPHGGAEAGTASVCELRTIHSTDAKTIVAHAARQFRTMGFCFLYAIKGSSVVSLMKRGHFAQRDVRALVAEGYNEWCYSSVFSCKTFMLADGSIVETEQQIDCSPRETTAAALQLGRAMGML